MIYTCFEMIRDCRDSRAEGWRYFVSTYVPVIHKLSRHYLPGKPVDDIAIGRVLTALHRPDSDLFQSLEPVPERYFVAHLRQNVLELLQPDVPAAAIDLETVAAALEPMTLVEKQAAWLETMLYPPAETAVLLRMAPPTVDKIRTRSAELVRGKADSWNNRMLAESGRALGRAAASAATPSCLAPKTFLDMLDGRSTWRHREELEQHATSCWHCIDHFCRLVEVVELLRGNQPLSDAGAAPFWDLLAVSPPRQSAWKRWRSGRA
ncbi:MAG TPA: hypothetical protein VMB03_20790 [Bryobacteraceae bacterium]|nr:hypothetical protein [Bryobacteraceae bacterium]